MSGKLGPDGFVILWMIQLGTWRKKLWERLFLASRVAPLTCWGVFGRQEAKGDLRVRTLAWWELRAAAARESPLGQGRAARWSPPLGFPSSGPAAAPFRPD